MREEKLIVLVVAIFVILGAFYALSSCASSGPQYYHVPGFDTHKSKTVQPGKGGGIKLSTSGGSGFRKR
jgi:hypothetical protein